MIHRIFFALIFVAMLASCKSDKTTGDTSQASANTNIVRVYTHRYFTIDQQLFNQFTTATGIKVEVVKDSDEALLEKIQSEAAQPQADIIIASDAWYLEQARKAGLLQPFSTEKLDRNVPTRYRDNAGHWTALDRGSVGLAYAKGRVDLRKLYLYNDITSPAYRGKLLLGDPALAANRGLVAGLIALNGEAATEKWLQSIVGNRAADVAAANNFDLIKALAEGKADMAIVPSNVLLQMKASGNPEYTTPAAEVGFIYLTQPDKNSVFYISGAGLLKNAPHRDFAVMLLEFLTAAEQQPALVGATIDLPINPMSLPHELFDDIGGFYEIKTTLNEVCNHYEAADALMQKTGWK